MFIKLDYMKNTFFISTAIDYPSARFHLGHAYEKIVTDAIARWKRLEGFEVHFSTGTDCHGLKIQKAAEKAGKKPEIFVEEMSSLFKELCQILNISYSDFIMTPESRHKEVVYKFLESLYKKGDIYVGEYEGNYCVDCETFYTEKDLVDGNCPVHKKKIELVKEKTYFFRMSKYQKELINHIKDNPNSIWPNERRNEILSRLSKPLRDLSISREKVSWGIPLPFDKNFTVTVWVDALINYLTTVDYPKQKFKKFWPGIHVIGKDISWHHNVLWKTMLISLKIPLPYVVVHGFINTESGEKMSKSRGTVIDPIELVEEYGVDPVRYFLLRDIPFGEDGKFSYKALVERNNNELANELGNLLNRTLAMIEKYSGGKIPNGKTDKQLTKKLNLSKIKKCMENFELHNALSEIFSFVSACNKYINDRQPWKLEGKERLEVLYSLADSIRIIAVLLHPFIPASSHSISSQLGVKCGVLKDCRFGLLKHGVKTKKAEILFKKIEWKEGKTRAREIKVIVEQPVKDFGLKVFSAVISNARVKKKHEGLEKLKELAVKEWRLSNQIEETIGDYERVHKELSVQAKNSVRNLIELVQNSGQLPQINTAVDCYNIVSLKHGLVVGAHDIEKLSGNIRFAIAQGNETYVPLGGNQDIGIARGEFAVLDDRQVICRLDEKQCEPTKIDSSTKNIVLYVQGNRKTSEEELRQSLKEICELIVKHCGGSYRLLQ